MTAKTNMLVTLSAGVFLAGSACAELTYTETAEPTGGWVISINGKNYAVGLNGKVKINGDAIVTADGYNIDKDYRVTYDGREITATDAETLSATVTPAATLLMIMHLAEHSETMPMPALQ